ncbi:28S ribosomal protein S18c, mitochondrial [Caenorhabditis elegans]|uniref:28S ribosomal protein S18c, mitochondrial n=1 Tax=Caenorhabditis elegans TaxID=6239 RepID=Q22483_CAEEL|nr:28S ribosomal protein S18c, mitochondrial [Caenorhabditis elegans]CCD65269.2 28S ribosomal protein S18c, mitochondrial [Caenorhabditis elegans]|eukprot:NP_495374.2 Mitochondrial Ribosomal Protein, Small [Caenorhabditis elegans]
MLKSASSLVRSFIRPQTFRLCSSSSTTQGSPSVSSDDEPVILENNPYTKEPRKCLLCSTGVELDYKNSRLLQQFVSTFSGRVYDRHITGLCDENKKKLIEAIAKSRRAGFMPIFVKDPKYTRDPKLFDPLKPIRPHSFA